MKSPIELWDQHKWPLLVPCNRIVAVRSFNREAIDNNNDVKQPCASSRVDTARKQIRSATAQSVRPIANVVAVQEAEPFIKAITTLRRAKGSPLAPLSVCFVGPATRQNVKGIHL
jgi:hypothetical protein